MGRGLRLGGIGLGALIELVWEGFLGGLLWFPAAEIKGELGLGWALGDETLAERCRSRLMALGRPDLLAGADG